MQPDLIEELKTRYDKFFEDLSIDGNGILGKISNPRYKNEKLRISGYPYIGSDYERARKKILYIGLDIGVDELFERNTFHDFISRRATVAGISSEPRELGYNDHISGTYISSLFLLKEEYSWQDDWGRIQKIQNHTNKWIINSMKDSLPQCVLDYVALTNIHKFVTVGRKKRPGGENRKWYNYREEIALLMDEINILNPDIIFFQGSANGLSDLEKKLLNTQFELCIANHPSAWRNRANMPDYYDKLVLLRKSEA